MNHRIHLIIHQTPFTSHVISTPASKYAHLMSTLAILLSCNVNFKLLIYRSGVHTQMKSCLTLITLFFYLTIELGLNDASQFMIIEIIIDFNAVLTVLLIISLIRIVIVTRNCCSYLAVFPIRIIISTFYHYLLVDTTLVLLMMMMMMIIYLIVSLMEWRVKTK